MLIFIQVYTYIRISLYIYVYGGDIIYARYKKHTDSYIYIYTNMCTNGSTGSSSRNDKHRAFALGLPLRLGESLALALYFAACLALALGT